MKTILMTVLVTMTTAAAAQEATSDSWMSQAQPTLSRAEVRADASHAKRTGQMARFDEAYLEPAVPTLLRAQVVAELIRSRQSGEYAALYAEAYDFRPAGRTQGFADRGTVLAKR